MSKLTFSTEIDPANGPTLHSLIGLRLNQAIAYSGLCSRKAAARLISQDLVRVNGQNRPHHYVLKSGDQVTVQGQPLPAPSSRQIWIYHKPVGVDCNVNPAKPQSIAALLATLPLRLFPLGRLDKDSSGLLLLSNDGAMAHQLMHADALQQKKYRVTVDKPLCPQSLQTLSQGVHWQVGPHKYQSRPCQVSALNERQLMITLTEGLNRQIRYMCRTVGYQVRQLERVAINQLELQDPPGHCRPLSEAELLLLHSPCQLG